MPLNDPNVMVPLAAAIHAPSPSQPNESLKDHFHKGSLQAHYVSNASSNQNNSPKTLTTINSTGPAIFTAPLKPKLVGSH